MNSFGKVGRRSFSLARILGGGIAAFPSSALTIYDPLEVHASPGALASGEARLLRKHITIEFHLVNSSLLVPSKRRRPATLTRFGWIDAGKISRRDGHHKRPRELPNSGATSFGSPTAESEASEESASSSKNSRHPL